MATDYGLILGVLLTLIGASLLALGMVIQRYALAHPAPKADFFGMQLPCVVACGRPIPRDVLWVGGLAVYGVANGLKVVALHHGPQSVLSSVFSTLLIFNIVFARYLLDEKVTMRKCVSAAVLLVGAVLCVVGAPADVETDFDVAAWSALWRKPEGALYFCIIALVVLSAVWLTCTVERRYPFGGEKTLSPSFDHRLMILYPAGLGLDEACADLLIKGCTAMASHEESYTEPLFYMAIVLWIVTAAGSAFWFMRVVFRRYETTVALPVEYGTLNAASVLTGLLFYQEHSFMSAWQLVTVLVGSAIIVGGIYIGQPPRRTDEVEVIASAEAVA